MKYTKDFKELRKDDASIAGGKGASLGEMTQAGISVPEGFVVLASTFDEFLKETDLVQEVESILSTVQHDVVHTVENASEKIRALIESREIPEGIKKEILSQFKNLHANFVAVRSSATAEDGADHAWAGQLDSFLNTTDQTLLENVRKCWSSLFTPRAIFYRFEKDLHGTQISVAVVVQKMIQSEISGIAFSVHPITEDPNQLIIEAGFGLGEAIVSGSITPDSYVVEKSPRKVIDINVSTQTRGLFGLPNGGNEWKEILEPKASSQVLNELQILELADLIVKIENHYGFPCDIEWAYARPDSRAGRDEGKFYIVQSRPITTLSNEVQNKRLFKKDDYILTFWVKGVSVFVTDIHLDAYKVLEVLYVIDKGLFKQYFTKKAYEQALERGLEFYSDENKFDIYKKELSLHCETIKQFFESEIKNKKNLSVDKVTTFFEYTRKLCGDYSQMNFESTDKAFAYQEQNPVIKRNLTEVAKFKDVVRAVMNTVLFEPDGYLSKFFAILAKQFDINASILDNLTRREILELFEGKRPNESIVSKRQEVFVESYNIEGFLSGKEAEAIIQEFKENVSHSDIIKGQVASKGKVTGKVKIIPVDYSNLALVNSEMDKMEQGEILVAETTAPELMIACKKAGAIVTDTGGLMSHAAIISREFGIPCVIGTKFATQLLKDGDLVEVDADKGIVRILETQTQKDSSGELDFSKYTMISQGKRRTNVFDASLKIQGRSLGLEKEIGLGYKAIVINSLGEQFVDKESTEKIKEFLNTQTFEDVKKYIEKMADFNAGLEKKVSADSSVDYTEDFEKLYTYFFVARYLSEYLFAGLSSEQQRYIEEWRNNPHLFSSLSLYNESHPQLDSEEEGEWSWVILEGVTHFVHKNIRFIKENKEQGDISNEIKGMVGYPGIVQGKVRVVLSKEDINLVEEGEVIVAPMTTVDFGAAMKKAAAFVTDEGGVTSHAAIIAREMKKPCILRTQVATKILKTGDMVEVDADKGIVKIL